MNDERSQDGDERQLLRRFSRGAKQATGPCPSELEWATYVDGLASEAECARIEAHLAFCPLCLDEVVQARQLATAAVPEAPAGVAARARALVPARRAPGRLRTWRRVASWAAAAAAAIAVGFAGLRAGSAIRERSRTAAWVASEVTFQVSYCDLLSSGDVLGDLAREDPHE
jgi:anti-sigma factor RsiW